MLTGSARLDVEQALDVLTWEPPAPGRRTREAYARDAALYQLFLGSWADGYPCLCGAIDSTGWLFAFWLARRRRLSPSSRDRILGTVGRLLRIHRLYCSQPAPFSDWIGPAVPFIDTPGPTLSWEQRTALLAGLPGGDPLRRRNRALMTVALRTPLSPQRISSLDQADAMPDLLRDRPGYLLGHSGEMLDVDDWSAIESWRADCRPCAEALPLFAAMTRYGTVQRRDGAPVRLNAHEIRRVVQRHTATVGLGRLTFQDLRRGFAEAVFGRYGDEHAVQRVMGIKSAVLVRRLLVPYVLAAQDGVSTHDMAVRLVNAQAELDREFAGDVADIRLTPTQDRRWQDKHAHDFRRLVVFHGEDAEGQPKAIADIRFVSSEIAPGRSRRR